MPLRLRLALFGVGVVALTLVIFGGLLYALVSRSVNTNQDDALRSRARHAAASASSAPDLAPTPSLAEAPRVTEGAFDTNDGFRYFVLPFGDGYVLTGQSTRVPQSNLSGIVGFLVISGIPTLLAALAASWLVAGRALRPLKSVAIAAEDIGRTRDFGRRLPAPRSRDEVAVLSASFNGMLSRLQEAYESQRRFVADASHELRTPLATIQGNAGLLARS